jgi:hypothetical protein
MSKKMNSMKFTGDLNQLKAHISSITKDCEWSGIRNHVQCRFPNGAILNWWKSTGTVQVQGPDEAAAALEHQLFCLSQIGGHEELAPPRDAAGGHQLDSEKVLRSRVMPMVRARPSARDKSD